MNLAVQIMAILAQVCETVNTIFSSNRVIMVSISARFHQIRQILSRMKAITKQYKQWRCNWIEEMLCLTGKSAGSVYSTVIDLQNVSFFFIAECKEVTVIENIVLLYENNRCTFSKKPTYYPFNAGVAEMLRCK